MRHFAHVLLVIPIVAYSIGAAAQDRFKQLPEYAAYQEAMRGAFRAGADGRIGGATWIDATHLQFQQGSQLKLLDTTTGEVTNIDESQATQGQGRGGGGRGPRVARGRQASSVESPDEKWLALHRDGNLVIQNQENKGEYNVTSDGDTTHKYATGSWVYGEELNQNSAMWWSPDSKRIAFYEFDESHVKPFYLTTHLTDTQTELAVEGYPKAGAPNPVVGMRIYDIDSGNLTAVDVGEDKEQYVYNVKWRPDGSELIYNRTNRHQNVLEVMAANPSTGKSRMVLTETQETWQENSPTMRFLEDGERFIWETERTGWKHYELRHINGSLLNPLTTGEYPCETIVDVNEDDNWLYYTAFSSDIHIHAQLHRVRLDGSGHEQLTREEVNHGSFAIAPDHSAFFAITESVEIPPASRVYDTNGDVIATLAEADLSDFDRPLPELVTYRADDGVTDLYGILYKPADFDETKSYPLIVDVYGGPQSRGVRPRFGGGNPYCEFGFLIAKFDNRGTTGRGKAFESANYLNLGGVDLKDQADGVRFLAQRPYVDGNRVGITGHSYGGYMSALAIVKHPDVFHVAVAGSPVTDWKHYDTIYTERYMRTPQENPEGYKDGSCMTFAKNLRGKLLLLHGMIDDNVHPNNSWELAQVFQENEIPFTMMFFPKSAHGIASPTYNSLKWEFLYENLVEAPTVVHTN